MEHRAFHMRVKRSDTELQSQLLLGIYMCYFIDPLQQTDEETETYREYVIFSTSSL